MKEPLIETITHLLTQLIEADFPSLKAQRLSVKAERKCDYITQCELNNGIVIISFNERDMRRMGTPARLGALAHELCHAERDLLKNPVLRFAEAARRFFLPITTTRDERATDELVIAKGYGAQLLAFQEYHDGRYKKYNTQDGLTQKEIRRRLMKSGSSLRTPKS